MENRAGAKTRPVRVRLSRRCADTMRRAGRRRPPFRSGQRLEEMADRHDAELRAAIAADETGDGFIYEAFLHELDIYEYGRTDDVTYALEALGFTAHEILNDPRLKRGFDKAVAEIRGRESPQP